MDRTAGLREHRCCLLTGPFDFTRAPVLETRQKWLICHASTVLCFIMDRRRQAALNNAEWCAAVWRTHDLQVEQVDGAWFTRSATPSLYPNVVTIAPEPELALLIDLATSASNHGAQFAVKDSFDVLPLQDFGFAKLFDAQWLWIAPSAPSDDSDPACRRITDATGFATWIDAWQLRGGGASGILLPELLNDQRVEVWGKFDCDEQLIGGLIAYRSLETVGITNVFGSPNRILASLASIDAKPIVCWQHGSGHLSAEEGDFRPIGPLTVWTLT